METTPQAVSQQYLTKQQARLYTGLSERYLDQAREKGELDSYKVGKRVLFARASLDAYLERHHVGIDLQASSGHTGEVSA